MDIPLAAYAKPRILALYPTMRSFAVVVYPKRSLAVAATRVAHLLNGTRPAPAKHWSAWVDALQLDAHDAEVLRLLFVLTHLEPAFYEDVVTWFNQARAGRGLPPFTL